MPNEITFLNNSGVKGQLFFYTRVDRAVIQDEQDIELNFKVENKVVFGGEIHFEGVDPVEADKFKKSGWKPSEGDNDIAYKIILNQTKEELKNDFVSDELQSSGTSIDKSALVIYKGKWVHNSIKWISKMLFLILKIR